MDKNQPFRQQNAAIIFIGPEINPLIINISNFMNDLFFTELCLAANSGIDHLTASHESFRAHAARPRNRAQAFACFLETCATKKIDIRPFRSEPRAVKRRPKPHPLLTEHRSEYHEISHRNRYRKAA